MSGHLFVVRGDLTRLACDAVVVPSSPENLTFTPSVLATGSTVTIALPVPSDAFGGASAAPLRVAV